MGAGLGFLDLLSCPRHGHPCPMPFLPWLPVQVAPCQPHPHTPALRCLLLSVTQTGPERTWTSSVVSSLSRRCPELLEDRHILLGRRSQP